MTPPGPVRGAAMRRALAALWHIWDVMDRLNLSLIAAGVGFFAMLSLFPTVAAIVLVWSLFADPHAIEALVDVAGEVVPPEVERLLRDQVAGVMGAGSGDQIGWATIISLVLALWSARAGVAALVRGLNAAYDIGHRQNIFRRYLADIGVTLTICGLTLVAVAAVVVAPILIRVLPLGTTAIVVAEVARWAVALGVVMMTLGIVYRFGPNRRGRRPGWITPGAIVATVLWLIVSMGFSAYLANFANYNEIYGSLGAAVALLMWFYLSAYVVLMGGALNAAIEAGGAQRLTEGLQAEEEARAKIEAPVRQEPQGPPTPAE